MQKAEQARKAAEKAAKQREEMQAAHLQSGLLGLDRGDEEDEGAPAALTMHKQPHNCRLSSAAGRALLHQGIACLWLSTAEPSKVARHHQRWRSA